MVLARHKFAQESVVVPPADAPLLQAAEDCERLGNWYLSAEHYSALSEKSGQRQDIETSAKMAARAATCYEACGQTRAAARLYEVAARSLESVNRHDMAAELYNRSAINFNESGEHFFAAQCWGKCSSEFSLIPGNVVHCTENYRPLPVSSLKDFLCGSCLEAAAEAYSMALGNEMCAVRTYWEAGEIYSKSSTPNIQAFEAYSAALKAGVKYYGTLEMKSMRSYLPLTDRERSEEVDVFFIVERALEKCNQHHQLSPGPSLQSRINTDRKMAELYHALSVLLLGMGIPGEAAILRGMEKDKITRIHFCRKEYSKFLLYKSWKITSNYGESIFRWACSCIVANFLFAFLYYIFSAIDPVSDIFDYIYFSVITFTTLGYGDIHPVGLMGRFLACSEVAAGFSMFGLLLSTLSTRLQR